MKIAVLLGAAILTCGLASAGQIVVLNSQSGTDAPSSDGAPFVTNLNEQYLIAASQFSGVAAGSQITSLGFRLDGGQSTIGTTLSATSFSVELSTSLTALGAMSGTLANNIGPDGTIVLSGALSVPGGSFVGGAGPNPFYFLTFTTPYTYNGGNLLVTLNVGTVTGAATFDANTVGALLDSADPGTTEFFNVPVMAFTYTSGSVPEPSPALLIPTGAALLFLCRARLRKRAS